MFIGPRWCFLCLFYMVLGPPAGQMQNCTRIHPPNYAKWAGPVGGCCCEDCCIGYSSTMLPLLWLVMLMRFISWLTWNASMRKQSKEKRTHRWLRDKWLNLLRNQLVSMECCGSCRCMLWWTWKDGTGKHSPEHVSVRQRLSLESPLLLLVLPRPPSYPNIPGTSAAMEWC